MVARGRALSIPNLAAWSRTMSLLTAVSTVASAAACGDNRQAPPPAPDAPRCDDPGYPLGVQMVSVELQAPFELRLAGTGTRCEQIVGALTDPDPARRPPPLAELDVFGVTSTCRFDPDTNREVVRLRAPLLGGEPMYSPPQDVVAHVDASNAVVYLGGAFVPKAAPRPPGACTDPAAVPAMLPGATLKFATFVGCAFEGEALYTIAANDTIEVGDEGYAIDGLGGFRRVRPVDVFLASANVTGQLVVSDLNCCLPSSAFEHCVGARLLVDAITGEIVTQQPHCIVC